MGVSLSVQAWHMAARSAAEAASGAQMLLRQSEQKAQRWGWGGRRAGAPQSWAQMGSPMESAHPVQTKPQQVGIRSPWWACRGLVCEHVMGGLGSGGGRIPYARRAEQARQKRTTSAELACMGGRSGVQHAGHGVHI